MDTVDQAARYWREMANESIEAAKRELDAHSFNFAINRIYYASFYTASAALLVRGLEFKKHSGVRAAFHRVGFWHRRSFRGAGAKHLHVPEYSP